MQLRSQRVKIAVQAAFGGHVKGMEGRCDLQDIGELIPGYFLFRSYLDTEHTLADADEITAICPDVRSK
jgi:hypothetical protein